MSITVMKQALDALGAYMGATDEEEDAKAHSLMAATFFKLKEAIAATEKQEPVGEMQLSAIYEGMIVPVVPVELPVGTKLYTHPQPKRDWVGLRLSDTPDNWFGNIDFTEGAKWAERTLKERNE